jgi:DNA-binding NarL/FixJ family response regulator
MIAGVLQDVIQEAGGEVVGTISSGLASVGATTMIRPDIVIMDIGLPGRAGSSDPEGVWAPSLRAHGAFISHLCHPPFRQCSRDHGCAQGAD